MKKIILSVCGVGALALSSHAQGIFLSDATSTPYDTTISGTPNTGQDLNLELLCGTSAAAVNVDIVTLLLSSSNVPTTPALGQTGSATGDITSFGTIYDNSGNEYGLAAYAGQTLFFNVEAWTGNYANFAAAQAAGAAVGTSTTWSALVPTSPNASALDISSVGVINLVPSPEPTTMALAGLGGLSLLFLRRKK